MFETFFQSEYYFGTGGSQSYVGLLSKSKRYISNSIDYCTLESSFSNLNFCIFKYFFYKPKKRLLSIYEIYEKGHFFKIFENPNDYIFFENENYEIANLAEILMSKNKKEHIDSNLINEFNELRLKNLIKFKLKNIVDYYELTEKCSINIPKFFLKNTMNYDSYLKKKQKKF